MNDLPPTLTRQMVADLAHLSSGTIANMASRGEGPPFTRPSGGKAVYRTSDVLAWLNGGAA